MVFRCETDEIDSYMYQTVGHSGLHAIAAALELPLFTHTISGTPLNLSSEYGSRQGSKSRQTEEKGKGKHAAGDETEDLYELLLKVKVRTCTLRVIARTHGAGTDDNAGNRSCFMRSDSLKLPASACRACVSMPYRRRGRSDSYMQVCSTGINPDCVSLGAESRGIAERNGPGGNGERPCQGSWCRVSLLFCPL